jgi:hypothetical protein
LFFDDFNDDIRLLSSSDGNISRKKKKVLSKEAVNSEIIQRASIFLHAINLNCFSAFAFKSHINRMLNAKALSSCLHICVKKLPAT